MTDELSINININGRIYPLKIDRKEEEMIRKAVKMINDIIVEYKKKYINQDAQDFLAMTAFQFALKNLEMQQQRDLSPLIEDLKVLDESLGDFLSLNE